MNRLLILCLAAVGVVAAGITGFAVVNVFFLNDTARTASYGTADIGGPFTLIDAEGRTVTDSDFRGEWMLIYFGFTFCPDVCPTELMKMQQALDELPAETAGRIQPIFISVDPERDGPEEVGLYASNFHPRLIGLTGSVEQVATAARAYRVYYQKADVGGASDYLVDHSSIIYLMDPEGTFVTHFSYDVPATEMAERIAGLVPSS